MPFERQRELKPSLFSDRRFAQASPLAQLVFLMLGWYADDAGRQVVDGLFMRNVLFPGRPEVTSAQLDEVLLELDQLTLIEVYASGQDSLFQIAEWARWWRVDRPGASSFPAPPPRDDSRSLANARDPSRSFVAVEGESERASEGAAPRDSPPDPFCKAHPEGTDDDCRSCGRARLRLEKWHHERYEHAKREGT